MATWTPKYKTGDTLALNSGGPVMSVKFISKERQMYNCQWFAGKKLDSGEFREEQLIPADPKTPLPPPETA